MKHKDTVKQKQNSQNAAFSRLPRLRESSGWKKDSFKQDSELYLKVVRHLLLKKIINLTRLNVLKNPQSWRQLSVGKPPQMGE